MATELDLIKAQLASIERQLQEVRSKIEMLEKQGTKKPRPFAELRGIWKGVDFTYEEIQEAKYKLREEDRE